MPRLWKAGFLTAGRLRVRRGRWSIALVAQWMQSGRFLPVWSRVRILPGARKVRHPSGVRGTTGTGPMWRVPAASTLSWHSKRLRVVAMAGGARHIRAGGWRPASGWTRKPAYRRVVQMAARRSLEPYVAGSNPAPPANHPRVWAHPCELSVVEGSRGWSRRPPVRGWLSGRASPIRSRRPTARHWRTG